MPDPRKNLSLGLNMLSVMLINISTSLAYLEPFYNINIMGNCKTQLRELKRQPHNSPLPKEDEECVYSVDIGSQRHMKVAVHIVQQAIKAIDQMEATEDSTSENSPKMDYLTINHKYNARSSGIRPNPRQAVL